MPQSRPPARGADALARRNLNENSLAYHVGRLYRETPKTQGKRNDLTSATEQPESVAEVTAESTAAKLATEHAISPAARAWRNEKQCSLTLRHHRPARARVGQTSAL